MRCRTCRRRRRSRRRRGRPSRRASSAPRSAARRRRRRPGARGRPSRASARASRQTWTPTKRSSSRCDVVRERRRVPEVPDVELDAERGRVARLLDQLDRLGDRRGDRPVLAAVALVRLERRSAGRGAAASRRERPQAVDDGRSRVVRVAPAARCRSGRRCRSGGTARAGGATRRAPRRARPGRRARRAAAAAGSTGRAGRPTRDSSPDASSSSSASASSPSGELHLPDADPVERRPRRRRGRRPRSCAASVVTCEIEMRGRAQAPDRSHSV